MNYEQLRAKVTDAVILALPVDPAPPHRCVTRFAYTGPTTADTTPVWGPPEELVEAVVSEVMQALFPEAVELPLDRQAEPSFEPMQGDPRVTGRWSCRCDSSQCRLVWEVGCDASADPSQVLRVTCQTHAIFGDSEPARVAANEGMRQRAQALHKLDLAHAEQCR